MLNTEKTLFEKLNSVTPPAEAPSSVYLKLSTNRAELLGATLRAEDSLGVKVGSGYIHSVRIRNGASHVGFRILIQGQVYHGSVNWDETHFAKISLSNINLEVVL